MWSSFVDSVLQTISGTRICTYLLGEVDHPYVVNRDLTKFDRNSYQSKTTPFRTETITQHTAHSTVFFKRILFFARKFLERFVFKIRSLFIFYGLNRDGKKFSFVGFTKLSPTLK